MGAPGWGPRPGKGGESGSTLLPTKEELVPGLGGPGPKAQPNQWKERQEQNPQGHRCTATRVPEQAGSSACIPALPRVPHRAGVARGAGQSRGHLLGEVERKGRHFPDRGPARTKAGGCKAQGTFRTRESGGRRQTIPAHLLLPVGLCPLQLPDYAQ